MRPRATWLKLSFAETSSAKRSAVKITLDAEKPAGLQAGGPLGVNMRVHTEYLLFN